MWPLAGAYVSDAEPESGAFAVYHTATGQGHEQGEGVRLQYGLPSVSDAWVSGIRRGQAVQ